MQNPTVRKRVIGACSMFLLFLAIPAWCEDALQERLLLPHNAVRGYIDFEVAPPHNEVDMGICDFDGVCSAYARYVWSGYLEVQPFGRGPLRRVFLFAQPKLFGGNNVPQISYSGSGAPILFEHLLGVGVELRSGLELRLSHHRTYMTGRFDVPPGMARWRTDGPYGLYTTVGVRWYFGGYGKSPHHVE